jgi:hypothetical protein
LPQKQSTPEHFWSRVRTGQPDECWEWQGSRGSHGHGVLGYHGKRHIIASRLAYELTFGTIPSGLFICHRCDNPPCCNPAHLYAGTQAENMADRVRRGRWKGGSPVGERCGASVLTEADVLKIKERHRFTRSGIRQTGRDYGVSHSSIIALLDGRTWSHVTLPSE